MADTIRRQAERVFREINICKPHWCFDLESSGSQILCFIFQINLSIKEKVELRIIHYCSSFQAYCSEKPNAQFVTNRLAAHLTDHSNDSMKLFLVWPQTPAEPVQTWKPKHSTDSVYLMDFSFPYYIWHEGLIKYSEVNFHLLNSPVW